MVKKEKIHLQKIKVPEQALLFIVCGRKFLSALYLGNSCYGLDILSFRRILSVIRAINSEFVGRPR